MNHSIRSAIAILCGALACSQQAGAAASREDAAKLKTTLTPMGAERAGNKDNTIPAWDGGYTKVAPGYKSGDPRPDPYAADKPVVVITAANMAQYEDKLAEGVKALLRKYPNSFKLQVYPTHRSAAAPQWVYDNIAKNAVRATTSNGGLTVEGAYGGIPFPIPRDGFEAMWNHQLSWKGTTIDTSSGAWVKPASGPAVLSAQVNSYDQYPYYFPDGSVEGFQGLYNTQVNGLTAPSYQRGSAVLYHIPLDQFGRSQDSWQYLPGQRRVRKVPNLTYDTPNFFLSGVANFDEFKTFFGPMDRYQMKLIGKKEMYVPYNTNRWWQGAVDKKLADHHPNPDFLRFELHRVWVVEATLAPGKRNVIAKRRFYLDEDTWQGLVADGWDANGQLWKLGMALPMVIPELPGVTTWTTLHFDFNTGVYAVAGEIGANDKLQYAVLPKRFPDTYFSPDALAGRSVR
jgi:hypothetical protein